MSSSTPIRLSMQWYQLLKEQDSPVLIYQMGKVGSSALEKSIPKSIHLHDLMSIDAEKQISPVRAQLHNPATNYIKRLLKRLIMSRMLKRKKQVRIISLVREPIGRNISMFFQSLPFWMAAKYLNDDSAVRSERSQLLHEAFEEHVNHQYPLEWFDNESSHSLASTCLHTLLIMSLDIKFTKRTTSLLWLFVSINSISHKKQLAPFYNKK